jgi:D-aminoacyl-tRNA deacylase
MIAVVQRVLSAKVLVADRTVGEIARGMAVLAAVHADDTIADIRWTAAKLASLRIFAEGGKNFERDVKQIAGSILLVSNFTVAAETRSGRRPSLSNAAPPETARALFDQLVAAVIAENVPVATGEFGADMRVEIINDGPVTFLVDSRGARVN